MERSSVLPPTLRHLLLFALTFLFSLPQTRAQEVAADLAHTTAHPVPAWLDQAVVYEIFPRAFSEAGTLTAVTDRLDALHTLGVNVLWIMPVHPVGQAHRLGSLGSPYAPRDYFAIDPALGTKADFARLVDAAHARGMRVILDMVADHTSWDSPLLAAHPDFYTHDAGGKIVSPQGWSDVAGLNYTNPALRQYMVDMFVYWMQTFHLDGFRCDAATYVPTAFWEQLRPAVLAVRPDALLLAEAARPDLMTKAFDLDYAWPLLHSFNDVLEHGEPATTIEATWKVQQREYPQGAEHLLISDDHDEPRAVVRYGDNGALAATALVFTLPGVPMLYNGMEVGDASPSGAPALFEKRPIYWSPNPQFTAFYRALIPLRASSPALRHGTLVWLHNSDEAHVVSFLRQTPEETYLITVNLSNTPFRGTVEAAAPASQHWDEVSLTPDPRNRSAHASQADTEVPKPAPALPALSLNAFQVRIFRLLAPPLQP